MSKVDNEDNNSSVDEGLLLDGAEDEGDRVHIPEDEDADVQAPTANQGGKKKKRLTKGGKSKAAPAEPESKKSSFADYTGIGKEKNGQKDLASAIVNEGDVELPDDAEKELPADQEYRAEADQTQEEDEDEDDDEVNERPSKRPKEAQEENVVGLSKKMKRNELITKVVNVLDWSKTRLSAKSLSMK